MSPILEAERRRVKNIPLDEGKGEGWHRHTNLQSVRACASKEPLLLGTPRHQQNLDRCMAFVNANIHLSHKVFRFEWMKVKRLLRPCPRNRWKPLKYTDRQFFEKVYKLEDDGDDWEALLKEARGNGDGDGGGVDGGGDDGAPKDYVTKTRQEYLRGVLRPEHYFSVPITHTDIDAEGCLQDVVRPSHFQILSVLHGSKRPKVIDKVCYDDEDRARAAPLSVGVRHLDTWSTTSDVHRSCYFSADPTFMNVFDLGNWNRLFKELTHWETQLSDAVGCVDLVNPTLASSHLALEDPECPVLMLLERLRELKWIPFKSRCAIRHAIAYRIACCTYRF